MHWSIVSSITLDARDWYADLTDSRNNWPMSDKGLISSGLDRQRRYRRTDH